MSRFGMGVCGYCFPGLTSKQKREAEKVPVVKLPNGVECCHPCYKKIGDK